MTMDILDFLFDLRGYIVLEQAVSEDHLAALNAALDDMPELGYGDWHGRVQRLDNNGRAGCELQNIVEAGEPFERLIDHPAWLPRVRRYCGEEGTYVEGLFIDECFASIRRAGGYFPMHSGGQDGTVRNQYRFVNGQFRCGQVNVLVALSDIGPGDGGTRILPGSHKSSFPHPVFSRPFSERAKDPAEQVEGSIDLEMKAGDALVFVDAVAHGASSRTNPGERRVVIYRYGPSWGATRHGYRYSPELLERLPESRRKILEPIPPRLPGAMETSVLTCG